MNCEIPISAFWK